MFIICGRAKSGTTLFASLMAAHPKIEMLYEQGDVLYNPDKYQFEEMELYHQDKILGNKLIFTQLFDHRNPGIEDAPFKLYRNTKVCFIFRDPRDYILLFVQKKIYAHGIMALMKEEIDKAFAYISKHFNWVVWIKYESLIFNTEATLSGICDFLEIEYTPDMLNFKMAFKGQEKKYGNKISTSRTGIYKTHKDQKLVKEIERVMKDYMIKLGYEI